MYSDDDWASIPALDGYQASTLGEIRSPAGKIMSQRRTDSGGWQIEIAGRTWQVHRLVLTAFTGFGFLLGYRPKHLNEDKSDNRLSNLVWHKR